MIPSYNRGHLLAQTLPTYLQENVVELILVDDCSTDNTLQVIRELQLEFPQIKYLRNERNLKQTASKNRGMEIAKGDYIYFGDDDSFLLPGTIHALKQTLEYYECGAVMARPLCAGANYKPQYHNAYIKWITNRNLAKSVHEIYNVASLYFDWGKWLPYPIEVPCLPACMLLDTSLARKSKFDTNYKGCAYREETDFSFRLNLDLNAKLMYDSRGVQINLPVYMVRNTGARSGGYEVWRKTAIECNDYFLDKLWDKIKIKYKVTKSKDEMKKLFVEGLPEKESRTPLLKQLAKDAYFYLFVNK